MNSRLRTELLIRHYVWENEKYEKSTTIKWVVGRTDEILARGCCTNNLNVLSKDLQRVKIKFLTQKELDDKRNAERESSRKNVFVKRIPKINPVKLKSNKQSSKEKLPIEKLPITIDDKSLEELKEKINVLKSKLSEVRPN